MAWFIGGHLGICASFWEHRIVCKFTGEKSELVLDHEKKNPKFLGRVIGNRLSVEQKIHF